MAPSAQIVHPQDQARPVFAHNPLALWHLLSLDAPTVAVLWTWFLARANGIHLPLSSTLAMGIAVWLLYASDRILDTRQSATQNPYAAHDLEERHYFHRSNLRAFASAIAVASLTLAALVPRLYAPSLRLYLVLGTLLILYFCLIHTTVFDRNHRLPKELAVGVFFSAATFIPTISRQPALRPELLPAATLFAVLCSLNCLFIYAWEHPAKTRSASSRTHPATRLALSFLPEITGAAAISGLALALLDLFNIDRLLPWPIPAACALSALLLLLVHRLRTHLGSTTLRASADLCLLTPILVLPFLPR